MDRLVDVLYSDTSLAVHNNYVLSTDIKRGFN